MSDGVAALIPGLIDECSNTVEQGMIPGNSNDDRDVVTVTYADIPSDPPFAGWARIFYDRPAYPLTVLKKTRIER